MDYVGRAKQLRPLIEKAALSLTDDDAFYGPDIKKMQGYNLMSCSINFFRIMIHRKIGLLIKQLLYG